jgi:hypothetical protein
MRAMHTYHHSKSLESQTLHPGGIQDRKDTVSFHEHTVHGDRRYASEHTHCGHLDIPEGCLIAQVHATQMGKIFVFLECIAVVICYSD